MTEAYQKHGLEDTALYILNKEYEVGNTDLDGYIGQLYGKLVFMRCWPSSIQSTSVAFENNDMEYEDVLRLLRLSDHDNYDEYSETLYHYYRKVLINELYAENVIQFISPFC
ncbi:hypothetical protein H8356DRAFT_1280676 [Neocallimastix lanati (nom. inval.)]|uniref:Uncharacterized protein n=1 Tax=Neocallimastix californiae TaxID=1754190 RepID=A0A1Y2CSW5_9FUNG|nr:hypothetical protein H8356DRAFT_1280676 [Neocallimastix sp. JGI-2020a]ORY50160.1 hypothetical protein LY90DRAFT_508570 [Neocallimastix californiae]|eukprot:ORY50160.1 hypothetical protein LY90DRAFT_508570 [Neocallimastix californiae]